MAHVNGDRVKDTTTTTGAGDITVSGSAPTGFQTLSAVLTSNGDTGFFCIEAGGEWEVSLLTRVSANVYSRTLLASSTGSLVSFSAGTKNVFSTLPGGRVAGKRYEWVPAAAMVPRNTNGAAEGSGEAATNKNMRRTLDFDASTAEFAQFEVGMPPGWNRGTVSFLPRWSHPSTSTNFGVVWTLAGVALSDGDDADVAFGTAQSSTDTGGTTDRKYTGPESSAITIAGTPALLDTVQFLVSRLVSDGGDTMAVDARLDGIWLVLTLEKPTDDA